MTFISRRTPTPEHPCCAWFWRGLILLGIAQLGVTWYLSQPIPQEEFFWIGKCAKFTVVKCDED